MEEAGTTGDPPPRKLHHLALGFERVGLIPLRFPILSLIILALLSVAAAFGIERLKVDDSLVVVEGKALLERKNLEKVRELVTDLQLVEGTRGLVSLFSARQPPEGG